jgi:GR25 family glycosyltransferase involved in LPS biosynthesis
MKIFVIHYTPLKERKISIMNQFEKNNITDYEFIETYDREDLNETDIKKFSNLKLSHISLILKNVEIFKKGNEDIFVIFEDDSILCDDFLIKLNEHLNNLPEKWDIIFSGECCNLHASPIIKGKILYETKLSRGAGMYILNKNVTNKLVKIFDNEKNINLPFDHWFNYIYSKYGNLIYYWTEPVLVEQGSGNGTFPTSII